MLNPRLWQRDSAASGCACCHKSFGFVSRRRHHCRRCGFVVCNQCSQQRLWLRFDEGSASRPPSIDASLVNTYPSFGSTAPSFTTTPLLRVEDDGTQEPRHYLPPASMQRTQSPTVAATPSSSTGILSPNASMYSDGYEPETDVRSAGTTRGTHIFVQSLTPRGTCFLNKPLSTASSPVTRRSLGQPASSSARSSVVFSHATGSVGPVENSTYFEECRRRSDDVEHDVSFGYWWLLCRACDACVRVLQEVLTTPILEAQGVVDTRCHTASRTSGAELGAAASEEERGERRLSIPVDSARESAWASGTTAMRDFLIPARQTDTSRTSSSVAEHKREVQIPVLSHGDQLVGGFTVNSWLFDVRRAEDMRSTALPTGHVPPSALASSLVSSQPECILSHSDSPRSPTLLAHTGGCREDSRAAASVYRSGPLSPSHDAPASSPALLTPNRKPNSVLPFAPGIASVLTAPLLLRLPVDEATRSYHGTQKSPTHTRAKGACTSLPHPTPSASSPTFAETIRPDVPRLVAESGERVSHFTQVALRPHKLCLVVIDERGVDGCESQSPHPQISVSATAAFASHLFSEDETLVEAENDGTGDGVAPDSSPNSPDTDLMLSIRRVSKAASLTIPPQVNGDVEATVAASPRDTATQLAQALMEVLRPLETPAFVLEFLGPTASPHASRSPPQQRHGGRQSASSLAALHARQAGASFEAEASVTSTSSKDGNAERDKAALPPSGQRVAGHERGAWVPAFDPWSLAQQQQHVEQRTRRVYRAQSLSTDEECALDAMQSSTGGSARSEAHGPTAGVPEPTLLIDCGGASTSELRSAVGPLTGSGAGSRSASVAGAAVSVGAGSVFKSAAALGDLLLDLPVLVMSSASHSTESVPTARTSLVSRWRWHAVIATASRSSRARRESAATGSAVRTCTASSSPVCTPVMAARAAGVHAQRKRASVASSVAGAAPPPPPSASSASSESATAIHSGVAHTTPPPSTASSTARIASAAVSADSATVPTTAVGTGARTSMSLTSRVAAAMRASTLMSPAYMQCLKKQLMLAGASVDGFVILVLRREPCEAATTSALPSVHAHDVVGSDTAATSPTPLHRSHSVLTSGMNAHFSPESSFTSLDSPHHSVHGTLRQSAPVHPESAAAGRAVGTTLDTEAAHAHFSGKELREIHQHLLDATGKASVPLSVLDVWTPPGRGQSCVPAAATFVAADRPRRDGSSSCSTTRAEDACVINTRSPTSPFSLTSQKSSGASASLPISFLAPALLSTQIQQTSSPHINARHVDTYSSSANTSSACLAAAASGASAQAGSNDLSSSTTASASPHLRAQSSAEVRASTPGSSTVQTACTRRAMESLRRACCDIGVWYGRQHCEVDATSTTNPPSARAAEAVVGTPCLPLLATALTATATTAAMEWTEAMET